MSDILAKVINTNNDTYVQCGEITDFATRLCSADSSALKDNPQASQVLTQGDIDNFVALYKDDLTPDEMKELKKELSKLTRGAKEGVSKSFVENKLISMFKATSREPVRVNMTANDYIKEAYPFSYERLNINPSNPVTEQEIEAFLLAANSNKGSDKEAGRITVNELARFALSKTGPEHQYYKNVQTFGELAGLLGMDSRIDIAYAADRAGEAHDIQNIPSDVQSISISDARMILHTAFVIDGSE